MSLRIANLLFSVFVRNFNPFATSDFFAIRTSLKIVNLITMFIKIKRIDDKKKISILYFQRKILDVQ